MSGRRQPDELLLQRPDVLLRGPRDRQREQADREQHGTGDPQPATRHARRACG